MEPIEEQNSRQLTTSIAPQSESKYLDGMWLNSREKKRVTVARGIFWLAAFSILILLLVEVTNKNFLSLGSVGVYIAWLVGSFFVYAMLEVTYSDERKKAFELKLAVQDFEAENKRAGTSFDELWHTNQKRLELYHQIATEQATRSFRHAQVAASFGFLVLIGFGLAAWLSKNEALSIASGVAGISGAALGGYISRTFMASQEHASQHMQQYFAQPLNISRALMIERMIEGLPPDLKAGVLVHLIEAIGLDSSKPSKLQVPEAH